MDTFCIPLYIHALQSRTFWKVLAFFSSSDSLEHVGPRRQKSKREQASSAPLHYAIIVDEQKIKVRSPQ